MPASALELTHLAEPGRTIMANRVLITSALIVLEFINIFCQIDCIGSILQHPQSRLVPIGVEVTFTCIFSNGLNPHWVIDGDGLAYSDSVERVAKDGYIIQREETADHISLLSLMFNATLDKNGTKIYCSSFNTHSNVAVLLVLSETPLIQNPFVMNPNKSSILLKWSPPFLWPGSVIDHYLISTVGAAESDKMFYRINATFRDAIVSFLKISDYPTEIRHCSEILFDISAITDHHNGTELASFTVVGGYLPNVTNLTLGDVNITVLFESDGSPIVTASIKLPKTICNYQHVNYSICIEGGGKVFQRGPYQQYGPKLIRNSIPSSLEKDKSYTMMVMFDTQAGIFYSQQYLFNTSLRLDDHMNCSISLTTNEMEIFVYKVVAGIFIGVTMAILLLILIMSLAALCQRKLKRTGILINSSNRVMVHNPIYDGPVYDSIAQSQFDTLPTNFNMSGGSADGKLMLNLSGPSGSDEVSDNSGSVSPKHYVQQSHHSKMLLSNSMCANSEGSAPGADIVHASEATVSSQSVGIVASNDTLPPYSECTSDGGNLRINETPKCKAARQTVSEELRSKDDEDSKYTVMKPIGAIAFSLDAHDNGFGPLN